MSPWLTVETRAGRALRSNGREIRPIAWSMHVNLLNSAIPFGLHFQWVRPLAVEVKGPDGTSRMPVPDVGLYVGLGLALVSIMGAAAELIARGRTGTRGRRR